MKKYIPADLESKWQEKWKEERLYLTDLSSPKEKYYALVELPYTSGDLHMGHWFTFTMGDVLARLKRAQGFNVLYPNGFDTFGLPAENAAIKNNMHPRDWTYANIDRMRIQYAAMGVSIDWEKTAITCDPEYYKWNQWIFLKMFERGIAYRGKIFSNWCPNCKTVLADENVEAGLCWRCSSEVTKKEVEQWFFRLTEFAERLRWDDDPSVDWPKPLREAQNHWIGKSTGTIIKFELCNKKDGSSQKEDKSANENYLEVFTTRPDTLFGATFLVISPEHPLLEDIKLVEPGGKSLEVKEYIKKSKTKSELERKENKDKTGVFTGFYAKNPINNEQIPIWIADYVLMGYGTGAIMAVPAHDQRDFEFAKKFDLPIKQVIEVRAERSELRGQNNNSKFPTSNLQALSSAYEDEGFMVNSGEYDGLSSSEAREKISKHIVENQIGEYQTNYHLHDWSISRQRYWGTPIPVIYCDKCGTVPVPESDLPIELPYDVDYTPQGKPPLATVENWVKVACPKCGADARREVDTMDGFVDNSWYFYRYLDPYNNKEIFSKDTVKKWIPVNIYIGGAEHTVGHTLYSRFFTKFFHDLGLVDFEEYALKRINHGVILGPDGHRMSKSRGNVINPDIEVKSYGADAIRVYLMFLGPYDIVTSWNPDGINGMYHFLQRVWGLEVKLSAISYQLSAEDLAIMHKTIKKVTEDIEVIKLNTAIAALMEWLNYLSKQSLPSKEGKKEKGISREEYKTFLLLLAPFAPHITEELWQSIKPSVVSHQSSEKKGKNSLMSESEATFMSTERGEAGLKAEDWSIHQQPWPVSDSKYLIREQITVAIQINGKLRDSMVISKDIVNNEKDIEKMALLSEKIQKFIIGKTIVKTIHVPGKILNFVVKEN